MRTESVNAKLASTGLDPSRYFVDHVGRARPLVVRHADGVPVFFLAENGKLGAYYQDPDPDAPPVMIGGRA